MLVLTPIMVYLNDELIKTLFEQIKIFHNIFDLRHFTIILLLFILLYVLMSITVCGFRLIFGNLNTVNELGLISHFSFGFICIAVVIGITYFLNGLVNMPSILIKGPNDELFYRIIFSLFLGFGAGFFCGLIMGISSELKEEKQKIVEMK